MSSQSDNWNSAAAIFKERCLCARNNFIASLDDSSGVQDKLFASMLAMMRTTKFGTDHKLRAVNSFSEFQKRVPIRDYDALVTWIEREVVCKGGVLTNSPISRWLKTSGSTGSAKKIPYTEYWMQNFRVPALEVLWGNYLHYCPQLLSHHTAVLDMQTTREDVSEFLCDIPYQGITNRHPLINKYDWNPPWYNEPWFGPDIPDGYAERMYYRLRYLLDQDVQAILTINPSTLITLQQHLSLNCERLIKDYFEGTLLGKKICVPNVEFARKLSKLAACNQLCLSNFWPNLKLTSCWESASAALYLARIREMFPGVISLPFMGCGTEGIISLPIDDHSVAGPLAITQGVYEFLPASEDLESIIAEERMARTLTFEELEFGKDYHLIMTQANGLCRYAVGDVYRVIGFYKNIPRLEYIYRQNVYHSFTGEKITEQQMMHAITKAKKDLGVNDGLFLCAPVYGDQPYYMIVHEKSSAYTASLAEKFSAYVDAILLENNDEYASKRNSHRLGAIKVYFISQGMISDFLEKQNANGSATQVKYRPLMHNAEILFEMLKSSSA